MDGVVENAAPPTEEELVEPALEQPDDDEHTDPHEVSRLYDADDMLAAAPDVPSGWHGPLESIVLKPRLFLLPIIVLVTLGVVLAFVRPPVYTAEQQLVVGSVVRNYQIDVGQGQAVTDLTDIYSRLVGSGDHITQVDAAIAKTAPVRPCREGR